jgi:hypothetical protein
MISSSRIISMLAILAAVEVVSTGIIIMATAEAPKASLRILKAYTIPNILQAQEETLTKKTCIMETTITMNDK